METSKIGRNPRGPRKSCRGVGLTPGFQTRESCYRQPSAFDFLIFKTLIGDAATVTLSLVLMILEQVPDQFPQSQTAKTPE